MPRKPRTDKFTRKYFKVDLEKNQELGKYSKAPEFAKREEANLIGSYCTTYKNGNKTEEIHMPVLDLDMPCELIPSSTPGHFHLLIDQPLRWPQYQNLLTALAEAGIIEYGYAKASIAHGGSYIRKPGIHKPSADLDYDNRVQEWASKLG
jgi:hypothetical protein